MPDGVEKIGQYSLGLNYDFAVQIPTSVTEINDTAFGYSVDIYYQGTKTEWTEIKIVDYKGNPSADGLDNAENVFFEIMPVEELLAEDEKETSGITVETFSESLAEKPAVKRKDRPLNGEDVFVIVGIFGGVGVIFLMVLRLMIEKYKEAD